MNVISCYRAAQIAQVSKQLFTKYKKVNADDKSKYPYFSFDKDTGEFGVDIDSKSWIEYMEKRRNSNGYDTEKEKVLSKNTGVELTKVDYQNTADNTALFMKLISAVEQSIIEVLKPDKKKLDLVEKMIIDKYRGMND